MPRCPQPPWQWVVEPPSAAASSRVPEPPASRGGGSRDAPCQAEPQRGPMGEPQCFPVKPFFLGGPGFDRKDIRCLLPGKHPAFVTGKKGVFST